ncbi:protein-glutamate O-methyltransferase CheR [Paludicola sp. MB14-C6]|uniref:CheR family methyltransferase n=1 Tax=Paludihabitans sp. MB14-C6 TaxID=3070656 RepID=UPI0027DD4441|nr:protein-glutamate O-methyltransferase CheR [Paludicola sp. MB14-C6]WMJ21901.1 protein-glutamate O-methyltransferase CheR [Paludicola sp. MB14-C6]
MIHLTDEEFQFIVSFMKSNYGINLINKKLLIESRMYNTLVERSFTSFSQYFDIIKSKNPDEIGLLINKLTTNHTYFMRENQHFDFLKNVVLPKHLSNNKTHDIRTWSAGCSSGEEAFTIAMTMRDFFGLEHSQWDTTILATDISTKVLNVAQSKAYDEDSLKDISDSWKKRFFHRRTDGLYDLSDEIRKQVVFRIFNLMEPFQYKKPFDIIFCRNVMIYFDQQTKTQLVNKFYDALNPGGYLLIGHSESIQRESSKFKYIQPSVYQK